MTVFLLHSMFFFIFIFDNSILTLCNTNITCDCTFITIDGSFIFFHGFKNWTGQFNRELDNNLVWLCLKTRNVRKSRFSLHLWSMFYAFLSESIFSVSPVHCSQNPQVPSFSNFFFKIESHGTIHIFKNYFAAIFSVFSNK